ncbi:MAG: nuclear transport factor 2 family protein [Acidimicrobiia bacterium]|nr:nuclear transport factor 2 family protein [Acidimicrobiia bacterium]
MQSAADVAPAELAGIETAIRDYIVGWYTGNVEQIDRALHDELVKRIPVADESGAVDLRAVSKERMLEMTSSGGGDDPAAAYEIHVDDVADDIATARVLSPEYLDYLHLARTPAGWQIVNVLFHMRA